jgi:hypothetical protein
MRLFHRLHRLQAFLVRVIEIKAQRMRLETEQLVGSLQGAAYLLDLEVSCGPHTRFRVRQA